MKPFTSWLALVILFFGVACSNQNNISYKDGVQRASEQADLKDETVSEDKDKNTITLEGSCTRMRRRLRLQKWQKASQVPGS